MGGRASEVDGVFDRSNILLFVNEKPGTCPSLNAYEYSTFWRTENFAPGSKR
jgi:hypothetical protein